MSNLTGESNNFFMRAMMGYRLTKALLVANRLGIFDRLARRSENAATLAGELGCDVGKLDILLVALAGMELVAVQNGLYCLTSLSRRHLVSTAPDYVGNNLRMQDLLWDNWSHLEDVVRTGKAWRTLGDLLANEDQSFTDQYIRAMQNISGPSATDVARIAGEVHRFVDVGAGPGNYSRALLDANPRAHGTLLDLPTTLAVTHEYMKAHLDSGRCALREGNYLTDDYGLGYDFALLSHTTHDEDDHGVAAMLERAFRALRPQGRVAIHDWVVEQSGAPLAAALFSLNLSVYTPGRVYRVDEYTKLIKAAGFTNVTVHKVLEGKVDNPTTLLIATKP